MSNDSLETRNPAAHSFDFICISHLQQNRRILQPPGQLSAPARFAHLFAVCTLLRQRMRGLRSVSFQLPCEEDVLQCAFEDKPLCVPRQLAELLQRAWRRCAPTSTPCCATTGGASASPPRRCDSSACGATRRCAC